MSSSASNNTTSLDLRSIRNKITEIIGSSNSTDSSGNPNGSNASLSVVERERLLQFEREIIRRCLGIVENQAAKRKKDGFNTTTYAIGVLNILFLTFMFAKYPEHFWLCYLIEGLLILPKRWSIMKSRKPSEVTCWLDFCWVSNFSVYLLVFVLATPTIWKSYIIPGLKLISLSQSPFKLGIFGVSDYLSSTISQSLESGSIPLSLSDSAFFNLTSTLRMKLFCAFWYISTGPLAGAAVVLGNAIIFHDVNNLSSAFIHIMPILIMYTIRWHREKMLTRWPTILKLDYMENITVSDIYYYGLIAYILWVIPFSLWMYFVGLGLPKKGRHTTVYNGIVADTPLLRKICMFLFNRSKVESDTRLKNQDWLFKDYLVYIVIHAICCNVVAAPFGIICFYSHGFHVFFISIIMVSSVMQGASRYSYYILKSYSSLLKKELNNAEEGISLSLRKSGSGNISSSSMSGNETAISGTGDSNTTSSRERIKFDSISESSKTGNTNTTNPRLPVRNSAAQKSASSGPRRESTTSIFDEAQKEYNNTVIGANDFDNEHNYAESSYLSPAAAGVMNQKGIMIPDIPEVFRRK